MVSPRCAALPAVLLACLALAAGVFGEAPLKLRGVGPAKQTPSPVVDLEIQPGNKTQMMAWLDLNRVASQKREVPAEDQGVEEEAEPAARSWVQQALQPLLNNCGVKRHVRPQRRNLVVTTAGKNFDASQWMSHPKLRTFELILVNYSEENVTCEQCLRIFNFRGPKWRIIYLMTISSEWRQLMAEREWSYIALPDDDLHEMNTCTFNELFNTMRAYDLLLGQPSVCDRHGTFTSWEVVRQRRECVLHYTNFVEVMAPTFNMDFFLNVVQHSLYNAWSGWGLDFTWVYLLRYPADRVAVIDEVCMMHFDRGRGGDSMYSGKSLPKTPQQEWAERVVEYRGLADLPSSTFDLEDAWKNTATLSCVPARRVTGTGARSAAVQLALLSLVLLQFGLLLGCAGLVLQRRGPSSRGGRGPWGVTGGSSPLLTGRTHGVRAAGGGSRYSSSNSLWSSPQASIGAPLRRSPSTGGASSSAGASPPRLHMAMSPRDRGAHSKPHGLDA